jgi:hypothetical protein
VITTIWSDKPISSDWIVRQSPGRYPAQRSLSGVTIGPNSRLLTIV